MATFSRTPEPQPEPTPFHQQVIDFAGEFGGVIRSTVDTTDTGNVKVTFAEDSGRALIELRGDAYSGSLKLTIGGVAVAGLQARIGCRPDSSGRYFAVTKSTYVLSDLLDREPLFRLEYIDNMRDKPSCHWQIHAERGSLTHLLTLSKQHRPHELSALHIPVGGARLRPCLEDFLQFCVDECGIDTVADYDTALRQGRESWRRKQIRTVGDQ